MPPQIGPHIPGRCRGRHHQGAGLPSRKEFEVEIEAIAYSPQPAGIAVAALHDAHRDLHMAVYEKAGSPWLEHMISGLWDHTERYRRLASQWLLLTNDMAARHRKVVEALLCGGREARRGRRFGAALVAQRRVGDHGGTVAAQSPVPFDQLDFLYVPSGDVAADCDHFTGGLGARLVFRIEAFGERVAMVELGEGPPAILLTDHLDGERPILVYRVESLDRAIEQLEDRGFDPGSRFGIPHGPCCSFRTPGGHRIAIYEQTRPQVAARLAGRRDF